MRVLFLISFYFLGLTPTSYSQNIPKNVSVTDSSLYAKEFLRYWERIYPDKVTINKDSIIVNNKKSDVIIIPTDIPLKPIWYYAEQGDSTFKMFVGRINYTDISFYIKLSVKGKNGNTLIGKGIARLQNAFWLGSEGVYETNDKDYGMNQYFDINNHQGYAYRKLLIPFGTNEIIDYVQDDFSIRLYKSKVANNH